MTAETASTEESADQNIRERYPLNGKTNSNSVNVRQEKSKKSRLVVTIKKKGSQVTVKGESLDDDGVLWYEIEYKGKEGFVRNDFITLEEPVTADNNQDKELYGLVVKKLATRSGPSPRAEDTGTYFLKGKRIRVYSRSYDPIENAWWVKCDVPYRGEVRTLWAWYTRFDSKTLPLESIPIENDVQIDSSFNANSTGSEGSGENSFDSGRPSSSNARSDVSPAQPDYDSATDPESLFREPLRLGSEGLAVIALKNLLSDLGYCEESGNDVFDDNTRIAVINFQKENSLEANGVVNWDMWDLLLSSNARPMPESRAIYVDVFDHYEEIPVQRSREVWDHDEVETVYYEDGSFAEITTPVYRTEYYTEIMQQPVYRKELRENVSPGVND